MGPSTPSDYFATVYARENAGYLGDRGHATTPGNIYLAHFLGPGGAVAMLNADPTRSAAEVNPAAAKANPGVFHHQDDNGAPDHNAPKSVSEVIDWAHHMMGDTPVMVDWGRWLTAIPADIKSRIALGAAAAALRAENERAGEIRAANAKARDEFKNRILSGKAGLLDLDQARQGGAGWLSDPKDYAELRVLAINESDSDLRFVAAREAYDDPGTMFSRFDAGDRKAIDLIYDRGSAKAGQGLLEGEDGAARALNDIVERAGFLPAAAADRLYEGMWSAEDGERGNAIAVIEALHARNPEAVASSLGEDAIRRMQDYRVLSRSYDGRDLIRRMDHTDSGEIGRRAKLGAEAERFAETNDLRGIIGEGLVPGTLDWEALAPRHDSARRELEDDFRVAFTDRYSVSGNERVAKKHALELLAVKWGVSQVGSAPAVMAYPPERHMPLTVGVMNTLVRETVRRWLARHPGTPGANGYFLVSTERTEAAVRFNQAKPSRFVPPPYHIAIITDRGPHELLDIVTGEPLSAFFPETFSSLDPPRATGANAEADSVEPADRSVSGEDATDNGADIDVKGEATAVSPPKATTPIRTGKPTRAGAPMGSKRLSGRLSENGGDATDVSRPVASDTPPSVKASAAVRSKKRTTKARRPASSRKRSKGAAT